ncbi:MAG: hypothetical protein A2096_09870 [Spirochaetes bacterium GWF1_41_5]|nr:MAG: hypothetical protein A2096_09870 [Spirochaetes bacterium GWF1_41_5]HBE03955.1 hypothetical protein [Spirochaetia bacterium]
MALVKYIFSHRCTNKTELNTDLHSHNLWQFLYLYKGRTELFFDKSKGTLRRNGLLIIKPDVKHKLIFPEPDKELCDTLQMKLYIADEIMQKFPWLEVKPYFVFNCLTLADEIESCLDLMNRQGKYKHGESETALEGLLFFLFAKLSGLHYGNTLKTDIPDSRITKVLDYINNNIEKTFTVGKLSETIHLEESYFIRIFRRQTGISPISYINQKKMECARNLLILTSAKLHEVARETGFVNYHYFSRLFRKIYKCSPQEFRIKNLKDELEYHSTPQSKDSKLK